MSEVTRGNPLLQVRRQKHGLLRLVSTKRRRHRTVPTRNWWIGSYFPLPSIHPHPFQYQLCRADFSAAQAPRQRIGRLKENSRGVAQHYDVELDTDESGQRATAVRFTRRPLAGTMIDPSRCVLPAQQRNRMGRGHPVAHLLHTDRPRGGVPLAEIRTRPTPDLSPQAHPRRRPSVHHRDRLSARAGHSHTAASSR